MRATKISNPPNEAPTMRTIFCSGTAKNNSFNLTSQSMKLKQIIELLCKTPTLTNTIWLHLSFQLPRVYVGLSICLSICLFAYLSVFRSVCLFVSVCDSAYLPLCLSVSLPICLSVYLPLCLSLFLSLHIWIFQPNIWYRRYISVPKKIRKSF